MPACASSGVYVPRDTHLCDAAVLVRHHVARFLESVEEGSHAPLPDFVLAELRGFAVCGDFSQGFVRTACRRCGDELRVPFPCKGRGFCPSCMGRRMAEGAALLVDHVLPAVGYRQWVLSFTGPMAVRLGYDRELLAAVSGRLARAHDAIEALEDGRVRVHFKSPWRRGAAFADMSVDTFLSRLCALVPPPRFHMTRYYGVFASHHRLRARVIPSAPQPAAPTQLSLLFAPGLPDELREATSTPHRYGWASLLARVFAVDVTVCSKCGGKMRILEVVTDPEALAELLHGARAPPRPCPPGQLGLFG